MLLRLLIYAKNYELTVFFSGFRKQATQLEELLVHSLPQMYLNDLEKVKSQLMIARDSATIKTTIDSLTGWKLPVPELMQRCCAILDIDNVPL